MICKDVIKCYRGSTFDLCQIANDLFLDSYADDSVFSLLLSEAGVIVIIIVHQIQATVHLAELVHDVQLLGI